MTEIAQLIGKRIRQLRKEKGLKAKELSKLSGISRRHISHLETGQVKNPGSERIERIANALNEPVYNLYHSERLIPEKGFDGDLKFSVSRKDVLKNKKLYVVVDIEE